MRLLAALLALLVFVPALRSEEAGERPDDGLETRTYAVKHLDVRKANAILSSLLDIRRTAIDEVHGFLVLRDRPERLRQAEELLARIDVPVPRWSARLIADTTEGPTELRRLQLVGPTEWTAGVENDATDTMSVSLVPAAGGDEMTLDAKIQVSAGPNVVEQLFQRVVTERLVLGDGDQVELVAVDPMNAQTWMRGVLGTSAPVTAVRLVVEREDSPVEKTSRRLSR